MDKLQRSLLTTGRFVLSVLLCAAMAATLLSFSLQVLFERDIYTAAASSEDFVSTLYTEAQEHLESECMFYDLPYDTLKTILSLDTVKTVSNEYVTAVYTSLCTGEELPTVTVDTVPFKMALDSFFETLPFEERPLDSDASQTIAGELAESLGLVMSLGISNKIADIVHPLFAKTSPLRQFAAIRFWLLLGVALLATVSLIPLKSTPRQRAYSTAGALFIGSALVAVPTWLFIGHDLPSKLAIGASALREFVNAVLYTVMHRMNGIATTAFVIGAVLLIASVIWNVKEQQKKTA